MFGVPAGVGDVLEAEVEPTQPAGDQLEQASSEASGAGPGRSVIATQPGGSAGMTPARTKELLPAPDGPTTASVSPAGTRKDTPFRIGRRGS